MTKSNTDIPILDDDAVGEIEGRFATSPALWTDIAALCQTVRALRAQLAEWESHRDGIIELVTTAESAAAAMRSACVAKLRQIAADYDNVAQPNTGAAISKQALLYGARQLESVSIQEQK